MTHDYAFTFICNCHSRLFGAESWSDETFCLFTRKLSLVDRHFFFIRLFSRNDSCRPENVGRMGMPISVGLPPFALLSVAQPARDIYISSVKARFIAKTQVTSQAFIIMINNDHTKRVFQVEKFFFCLACEQNPIVSPSLALLRLPPPIPTRASRSLSNDRFCTTHYHLVGRCCSKAVLCNPITLACTRPEPFFQSPHVCLTQQVGGVTTERSPFASVPLGSFFPLPHTLSFFTPPPLQVLLVPLLYFQVVVLGAAAAQTQPVIIHAGPIPLCLHCGLDGCRDHPSIHLQPSVARINVSTPKNSRDITMNI